MEALVGHTVEQKQYTNASFTHELCDRIFKYKITGISRKH